MVSYFTYTILDYELLNERRLEVLMKSFTTILKEISRQQTLSQNLTPSKALSIKAPEKFKQIFKDMFCTATNTVRERTKTLFCEGTLPQTPIRGKPTNTKVHCGSREDIARLRQIPLVMVTHIWGESEWDEGFSILLHIPTKLGCLQFLWFRVLAELTIGMFPLSAKCVQLCSLGLFNVQHSSDN